MFAPLAAGGSMLELYVRPPLPFQTPCRPSRGFLPSNASIRVVTAAAAAKAADADADADAKATGVRRAIHRERSPWVAPEGSVRREEIVAQAS